MIEHSDLYSRANATVNLVILCSSYLNTQLARLQVENSLSHLCVAQAGLKLVSSRESPGSASQAAGTTGLRPHAWVVLNFLIHTTQKLYILMEFHVTF